MQAGGQDVQGCNCASIESDKRGRREAPKLEFAVCAICGIDDCTPIAVGSDFEYHTSDEEFMAVQCRNCSLVYLNPRPDSESIGAAYPDHYHAFDFDPKAYGFVYKIRQRLEAKRLLSWCRHLGDSARILDIGCGDGFHIELLKKFGRKSWVVEGVDSDPRALTGATKRGLTIHCGRVEELSLEKQSYDLILMIMTIEHLSNPLSAIRRASELLRPGGRLVIVTTIPVHRTSGFFRTAIGEAITFLAIFIYSIALICQRYVRRLGCVRCE